VNKNDINVEEIKKTGEEIFNMMIESHYRQCIVSTISVLLSWLVCFWLFGVQISLIILTFFAGLHLGRAEQRMSVLVSGFSNKAWKHRVILFFFTIVILVMTGVELTKYMNMPQ